MQILIAGFGGQGVLFAGKFLAYAGMILTKQVSWLPSYGPEMRGGTANCSVVISDEPVGSPIVSTPDVLIAMNLPSFEKYQSSVVKGGMIIYDSTLISASEDRPDVVYYPLPATKTAQENGLEGLANMILAGSFVKHAFSEAYPVIDDAISKVVPPKKAHLAEPNRRAVQIGYEGRA